MVKLSADCRVNQHLNLSERGCLSLSERYRGSIPELDLTDIDWVIVGGESGPGARPMKKEWVTDIRDKCLDFNVALVLKRWGGKNRKKAGRLLDGRTWDQVPTY